jgi:endonuclease/exonuclease/phosphatase family metal-dependent hydrolase
MGAAFGFKGAKHVAAWEWLNAQDADVALLQEVVPLEQFTSAWGSVVYAHKWQNWGSAILVRDGGYEKWEPTDAQPWLQAVRGAVAVAKPADGQGLWLVSVHSDASSFEATAKKWKKTYQDLPDRSGIAQCNDAEMWEIEPSAHELAPVLAGQRFLFGGDLNTSLLYDSDSSTDNARLFENLYGLGYHDVRPRHSAQEVQTFFTSRNTGPFQIDHVFADPATEAAVSSWRVRADVASDLGLSDHAPIEIQLD